MNQQDLHAFYQGNLSRYNAVKVDLDRRLFRVSIVRLLVFLGTALGIYFLWHQPAFLFGVLFTGIAVFLYFVKIHLQLKYQSDLHQKLLDINSIESKSLEKDFLDRPHGKEFNDGQHEFCNDIDLFGQGSFFQYINRSALAEGPELLSNTLKSNDFSDILQKQEAIKDIGTKVEWRQEFWAEAQLVDLEVKPTQIFRWLETYQAKIPKGLKMLAYSFSAISVILIFLFALGFIPEGIIIIWFVIGLAISGSFLKRINELGASATKSLTVFQQYSKLIQRIENESWKAELLLGQQAELVGESRASENISLFARLLNALDQRNNLVVAVVTNGLFLRDILTTIQLENWIEEYKDEVRKWFEIVHVFDLYCSLGNFHFNHPAFAFSEILPTEHQSCLEVTDLGHPLLAVEKRVDNDFLINQESFFIVTGANMAGKSTFLRSVSLAIVMSNCGLPICASEARYSPTKLISSMRTTDSLSNDESYFFSELKRLKYIIDKIENEKHFIILDEILKGTNSVDKAAGSRKFVERLVKSHSTGIIATHDLSLCETSQRFEQIQNYYFDARIEHDELYFDYLLKPGICQNMNASFLLKKMDIV